MAKIIANSKTEEDPTHSINAWKWLLKLKPDADEITQLAVIGHDLDRAMPDRLTQDQFKNYDEYKLAHATRGGGIAKTMALENGYSEEEATRLAKIITYAEFGNENPSVNLVRDADSISFFDNNVELYLKRKGPEKTNIKMNFMYSRTSKEVQRIIDKILDTKPEIKQLFNQIDNS